MLTTSDLCTTLKERAKWTNRSIKQGLSTRLGIMEETITDMNLLEIAIQHDDHILTKKFTRRQEGATSGADWLWCIGEPGSWLLLLIQAKIINPKTGKCNYLNYNKGKQRNLLLKFARKVHAVPLYVIYAHVPDGYSPPPKASSYFSKIESSEWGCSFVTPKAVKSLVKSKSYKLENIMREGVPWSKPFCQEHSKLKVSLAKQLAGGLSEACSKLYDRELVAEAVALNEKAPSKKKERINWSEVDPNALIQEEFPRVVKKMLAQKSSVNSPVSSVSVISATPINELEHQKLIEHDSSPNQLYVPFSLNKINDYPR